MPLDGSPETVTPASLPAVAVPEPEPDVVQNANATAVTATTPAAPSAISTRFLVSFLPNIHCPPWSFEEPATGLILISAASSWEPPAAPGHDSDYVPAYATPAFKRPMGGSGGKRKRSVSSPVPDLPLFGNRIPHRG